MKELSEAERQALKKVVQNVCSLIVEIGVAIKIEAVPETGAYAEALIDGFEEMSTAAAEHDADR